MAVFFYIVLSACLLASTIRSGYGLYSDIKRVRETSKLRADLCKLFALDIWEGVK